MTTNALPGSVFAYGDPLIQFMLDRKPAPAASGMVNDWWPKPLLRRLPDELAAARPTYVYVDKGFRRLMRLDWTALLAPLDADYVIAARSRRGTWYRLRSADLQDR